MKRRGATLWLLSLLACARPSPAPETKAPPSPPPPTLPPPASAAPPHRPAAERPSLRLSWLPADTTALGLYVPGTDVSRLRAHLSTFLDTPPASRLRALPLVLLLPLWQLAQDLAPKPLGPAQPVAMIWGPQQHVVWLWHMSDLSLQSRRALQDTLAAQTRFEPPYWIFETKQGNVEYFVHTRAHWLFACAKDRAQMTRDWLKDCGPQHVGRLSWAPGMPEPLSTQSGLDLRWVGPKLLEAALVQEPATLPVTGSLLWLARKGLQINNGARNIAHTPQQAP